MLCFVLLKGDRQESTLGTSRGSLDETVFFFGDEPMHIYGNFELFWLVTQ